jgi:hypothetical protein
MFSQDVVLKDWENEAEGIENVLQTNRDIFEKNGKLRVVLLSEASTKLNNITRYFCQIKIVVDEYVTVDVVDIIDINDNNKIVKISAYQQ